MALNKSTKSTPKSRSSYFPEMTASAGKQNNFLLPVRIKITPKDTGPLSDGKKNPAKMLKPVLIKDLFPSTQKDRHNSTLTSISTQKKKIRSVRVTQPYLNTQSCYKPKEDEGDESNFSNRKSLGGNKVRRQLYQTLDSPQKIASESKENTNKVIKTKKKTTRAIEESKPQTQSKYRKSLLLPPNSIKNSFVKTSDIKPTGKGSIKSSTTLNKRNKKNISNMNETINTKKNIKTSNFHEPNDGVDIGVDTLPDTEELNKKKFFNNEQDNSTMTSSSHERFQSNGLSKISKLERPSVIMNTSKTKSTLKYSNCTEPPCEEMQKLEINETSCTCSKQPRYVTESIHSSLFDFSKMQKLDHHTIIQFKMYLEQSIAALDDQAIKLKESIQTCENQSFQFKQILNLVNNFFKIPTEITSQPNDQLELQENMSNTIMFSENDSAATEIIDQNIDTENISNDDTLSQKTNEIKTDEVSETNIEEKLPILIKVLETDVDMVQEVKDDLLNEMARLSTIGEVSCEADESNKYEKDKDEEDFENKENLSDLTIKVVPPNTLKTPKTPRRLSIPSESCDSQARRRSARLAAKRMSISSLSDCGDKQDSFTLLENELNLVHDRLSSKSLPASPMKPPMAPGVLRQWDKRVERPLKEYMALKMNGTFLVTPDVKRFQSCLESTETPHSRKSLSRKIFLELCDLYAESP